MLGLKLESMKEKLRPKAATLDEHRDVCSAFVTFRREEYKCRVLHAYRFVRHLLGVSWGAVRDADEGNTCVVQITVHTPSASCPHRIPSSPASRGLWASLMSGM